ncbi:MAG TPA: alpha/beta fold hydrolase [Verrucomicrobiales bacterium]|nr:alpha/beta fold hydrolase [Verrucomicrobiales bacterium]HIL70990.1 alpha/beta fold hydrolase [Verrucomicrobiota bacterium]
MVIPISCRVFTLSMTIQKAITILFCAFSGTIHAQSELRLAIASGTDDSAIELSFTSKPTKIYRIEKSTDLNQFSLLAMIDGTGNRFTVRLIADQNQQFYRALELSALITAGEILQLESPPPDHKIKYGNGPLQFGNLRIPKGDGPHPVVIFLHGGCWLSQFKIGHTALLEQALAREGYSVWSIEYRRIGDEGGGWPGTFNDVGQGADHLREVASQFNLDLTKVVASGHSAGGQLALWLAARSTLSNEIEIYSENPLPIHGVVGLAPAPDLEGLHKARVCGHVIDPLMEGSPLEFPSHYANASPMQLAPIGVPQALVIGTRDDFWGPIGQAYFKRAVEAGDNQVRVVQAPESGHFEMIVPTTSSWPVVRKAFQTLFLEIAD